MLLVRTPSGVGLNGLNVGRSTARQRLRRFGFRVVIGFVTSLRVFRQQVSGRGYRRVRTLRFTETLVGGIDWHDTRIPADASRQPRFPSNPPQP